MIHPEVLSSHEWSISKIYRCIDLAPLISNNWEMKMKVEEAIECVQDALNVIKAARLASPASYALRIEMAVKSLTLADGAITEAISVHNPYEQSSGIISNLRAGRSAIWEEVKALNRYLPSK